MENRTPDNLFANMALIKGLQGAGAPVNVQAGTGPQVGLESPTDVGHSYPELINEWDGGKLDGFANDPLTPGPGSGEVTPAARCSVVTAV